MELWINLHYIGAQIHQRSICDAWRDLVPFLQFKKCGKHPWNHGSFLLLGKLQDEACTLLKVTLFHECFSRFLNRANGTKSRKASHM